VAASKLFKDVRNYIYIVCDMNILTFLLHFETDLRRSQKTNLKME